MPDGRLIVIDGIDGAGSETQSRLLAKLLDERGMPSILLDYPDYQNPIGNFINSYLHGSGHIPPEVKAILYSADFLKDKGVIEGALAGGKTVVCCRYFTSTLAYQSADGFETSKLLKLAETTGMPIPDIAIYLRIRPAMSAKRKKREKGTLDRNESDLQLLAKVAAKYDELSERGVFCRWVAIDGERSVEKVFADVRKALGM